MLQYVKVECALRLNLRKRRCHPASVVNVDKAKMARNGSNVTEGTSRSIKIRLDIFQCGSSCSYNLQEIGIEFNKILLYTSNLENMSKISFVQLISLIEVLYC